MSRISQDFINNVGYLYEEINIQQHDFLNENSEYYDEEAAELVEDIISTISVTMVYEGYSAEGIIGFLADSSEEEIIEKYINFDENILTESLVPEEYIEEQLEILDEVVGALFRLGKFMGRVASKPARMKAAARLSRSNNPARTAAAYQKLANKNAAKAGFAPSSTGGSPASIRFKNTDAAARAASMSKVVSKVKDIGKGAKAALANPIVRRTGKALGVLGLGAAGGYIGAKMAGAGSNQNPEGSSDPTSAPPSEPPSAPSPQRPSAPSPQRPSAPPSGGVRRPSAPVTSRQTGDKEKDMATWAKANPKLAARLNPDGTQKGTGQSAMERSAEEIRQMANRSRQRQGTLMGGPEGPGKIDTNAVDNALKAEQERQKKRLEQQNSTSTTTKEWYEPYDVVLGYLLSEGHVDTVDEANYIMMEMDEDAVATVIEEYNDYLLAEEISEWVNDLVDEGYDLSEYTWDDIVEYYVTEAGRMHSASDQQASWHSQNTGDNSKPRSDDEIENEKGGKEFLERIKKTKKNPKYKK